MASKSHLSFSSHVLYSFLNLFSYYLRADRPQRLSLWGASSYRKDLLSMGATAPHHEYGKRCSAGSSLAG